jgi:type IV pilus biogenesis protein CpaD/CtpE
MATRRNRFVLAALLGAALAGCSSTPRFNHNFGDAVRANLSAQVLDPAASSNVNPVNGVDGKAALATQERYQRSFKEADPGANQLLVGSGTTR